MTTTNYADFIMAMERVRQRLMTVTSVLASAGIPYAVVGGNAVAAWVARADPAAVRSTKDVDILAQRADLPRITEALLEHGFQREDILGVTIFIDPDEPSVRSGVHLVWADELVRPEYTTPAPSVSRSEPDPSGFQVIDLVELIRMKLTSFRIIDQAHIIDLMNVGMLPETIDDSLSPALRDRLTQIRQQRRD